MKSSTLKLSFWGLIVVMLIACENKRERELPIMGRIDVQQVEVNGKIVDDTIYHTIPDFKFINQDSIWVTHDTFKDKIYVADFFFTSCPTICPIMKAQMRRVYEEFKDNDEILFLSHSIDPYHDNVPVLKEFSDRFGVDSRKWHFITGNKDEIYEIGEKSYMVTAQEDANEPGGYLHSGAFILVDRQKRIRGFYDGTQQQEVDRLIMDIPLLLK